MKCIKCDNDSCVEIAYARQDLCSECFCRQVEKRVAKANHEFSLLRRGDKIAVGVSGGKDSAALLYILHNMAKRIGEIELIPIAVDEGIQGYRSKALVKAHELCNSLGLQLRVYSYREHLGASLDEMLSRERSMGACSYCGVFRKTLLNKAALEAGANKLAVGHNLDDVIQTFLMNLLRNDAVKLSRFGVASEGEAGLVPRIKPLVFVPERECALYATLRNLPFYLGECPHSSEAFRGVVKNFLNEAEEKHPGTKFALLNSFLSLKQVLPEMQVKQESTACKECGMPCAGNKCQACLYLCELKLSLTDSLR